MNAKTLSALVTLFSGIGLCIAGFCVSEAHELNDSLLFYMGECLVYAGAIFNEGCSSFARLESISTNRKNPNYNSRSSQGAGVVLLLCCGLTCTKKLRGTRQEPHRWRNQGGSASPLDLFFATFYFNGVRYLDNS